MCDKVVMKLSIITILGWALLFLGVALYIFPIFVDEIGVRSGLVAFVIIFVGISLLKYRKDQINK